jgi:hypothetical protein
MKGLFGVVVVRHCLARFRRTQAFALGVRESAISAFPETTHLFAFNPI